MTSPIPTSPTPPLWPNGRDVGWVRSSFCASGGCVEVARDGDQVLVRDSRLGDGSPVQRWSRELWDGLLHAIQYNVYSPGIVDPGGVLGRVVLGLESEGHEPLKFSAGEWFAFRKGVKDGEFDFDNLDPAQPSPASGAVADEVAAVTGQAAACVTGEVEAALSSPVSPMNGAPIGDEDPGPRALAEDAELDPRAAAGSGLIEMVKPKFEWGADVEEWASNWAWATYGAGFAAGLAVAKADREALVDAANEWARATSPLVEHVPASEVVS